MEIAYENLKLIPKLFEEIRLPGHYPSDFDGGAQGLQMVGLILSMANS